MLPGFPEQTIGDLFMDWNRNRNVYNICPTKPPEPVNGEMMTCDGRTWTQDPSWISAKWRSGHCECEWDKSGNLMDTATYNYSFSQITGENGFVLIGELIQFAGHIVLDYVPYHLDGPTRKDLTSRLICGD